MLLRKRGKMPDLSTDVTGITACIGKLANPVHDHDVTIFIIHISYTVRIPIF